MISIWLGLPVLVLAAGLCLYFYRKTRPVLSLDDEAAFQKNCAAYHLSAREVQVLRHLLQGRTYRQTAESLYISVKTVDGHVQRIYSKVGVRNKLTLMQKLYKE